MKNLEVNQMRKATGVFLVVDPVQDYEESVTVLGVYGSLATAKYAVRYHRRYTYYRVGLRSLSDANYGAMSRETLIQRWAGERVLEQWTFRRNTLDETSEWIHEEFRTTDTELTDPVDR